MIAIIIIAPLSIIAAAAFIVCCCWYFSCRHKESQLFYVCAGTCINMYNIFLTFCIESKNTIKLK